jgi:2-polyprenyl-3-methyl-5-hydroxy-6-metoxy-1,4-benzoquinol methylase
MGEYIEDFDAKAKTWDEPDKVERAAWVAEAIARRVPSLSSARVLEYGSGTGLLGFALQPRAASVTLADASAGMIAMARQKVLASGAANVAAIQLDLTRDELPRESFDVVCTLMTLHHVEDVDGLLEKFFDLTTPGGSLCVCDLDREDGSFHGTGFKGHLGFDRGELSARLARAGFRGASFDTPYEIAKATSQGPRRYPLFLAVARKG